MRGSVVDLLPDPVSPLFATLAIPAVTRVGIKEVLRPLTRSEPDLPADYIATINDYAYMGVAFTPHQWWWILSRMMLSFPRMLARRRCRSGGTRSGRTMRRRSQPGRASRWRPCLLPSCGPRSRKWTMRRCCTWLRCWWRRRARRLGSEMLFTRVYEKMIRREGDPAAATFLMGYDSTPIRAEKSLYDLAMWCREQGDLAAYLRETPTERLVSDLAGVEASAGLSGLRVKPAEASNPEDQPSISGWPEFCTASRPTCATTATSSTPWTSAGRCRWTTRRPCCNPSRCTWPARGEPA